MTSVAGKRLDRGVLLGLLLVAVSAIVYWLANRQFDAGRGDFFYLADAFLHGRTWLQFQPGPYDVIISGGRFYVPFAPFPAVVLMPLVAVIGAVSADQIESGINALLAAASVGLCWMLLGRIGVRRLIDRVWLSILFGFSTQILWITTRGGVWHTGQLIATILTFACLVELWGRQRAVLIGLLAGAAFLTRAPLAFALPFYALMLDRTGPLPSMDVAGAYIGSVVRSARLRNWVLLGIGALPALLIFLAYNQVRFGSMLESGYGLATLPPFLEAQRAVGLFSIAHIPMNLDYFLVHPPMIIDRFPFLMPDGLGLSVLLTSPGLLFAFQADWRRPRAWWLAGATVAVLIPTLLYYGGGWFQYGFRYFLDSVPFVIALCGLAAVARGRGGHRVAIADRVRHCGDVHGCLLGVQLLMSQGVSTRRLILVIFVLSGAAGLVYEIVWSRQLVLVFGNTTQAVSAILAGFFGGMAIGSILGGRLADRVKSPLRLYGLIELVLVAVVVATPLTFRLIRIAYGGLAVDLEDSPQVLAVIRLGLALVALAPATILMGATLPTLTRYLSTDAHLSQAFGRLYAANTIGAILGTLAAGLILIEVLGLTGALWVGAGCSALAGVAALILARRARTPSEAASVAPVTAGALTWDGPDHGHRSP